MSKPTLILIPGLLCDKTVWEMQVQAFSPTYHIIIPDLSQAKTPADMVKAALCNAPESFALAGHSMGGWVALMVMEVARKRVTKLALLNTTAAGDTKEKAQSRLTMIAMMQAGEVDALVERLLGVYVHKENCKEVVRRMILRNINAFINEEEAMLAREPCEPLLPHITCNTLVISSNQDKIFSLDDANTLKNGITHSTLVCIDDCGHLSPMEAPDAVTYHMSQWLL